MAGTLALVGGRLIDGFGGTPLATASGTGWAAEFDCASWSQLFLKYLIAEPAVTVAIPATNKPEHMADNLEAGFGRLPDARHGFALGPDRRRAARMGFAGQGNRQSHVD